MTTPFINLTAAILYFGWLWHDRSAVERREGSLENQPTKETNRTRKPHIAQPVPLRTRPTEPFNLKSRGTVIREGIAQ